jgi:hypothetical protein
VATAGHRAEERDRLLVGHHAYGFEVQLRLAVRPVEVEVDVALGAAEVDGRLQRFAEGR